MLYSLPHAHAAIFSTPKISNLHSLSHAHVILFQNIFFKMKESAFKILKFFDKGN